MAANGRIPTAQLAALPDVFSNKRETEYLAKNAYASLVRMMLRATAAHEAMGAHHLAPWLIASGIATPI